MDQADFLDAPGRAGMFGGLLDEYARAAQGFCDALASVPPEVYDVRREAHDSYTASPRTIARHCCQAAWAYAADLRRAQGQPAAGIPELADPALGPADARAELGRALRETEAAVQALWDASEREIMELTFEVSWGATYDPESMLEHAIVHLLRHRRQLERW